MRQARHTQSRSRPLPLVNARLSPRGWLVLHVLTLVAALVFLMVVNARAWFLYDEWDLIVRATQPLTFHSLFFPTTSIG